MDSVGVPMGRVASGCKVVRLAEGATLRGVVGRPAVGCLMHWAGNKSQLCIEVLGDGECEFCKKTDVPQWQAFVPVRHVVNNKGESVEVTSLLMLGYRAFHGSTLKHLNDLVGNEVEFRRGKKRRFIELQVMLQAEAWDARTCENLAVLFGAGRFWREVGSDAYRNLLEAVKRSRRVAAGLSID